MNVVDSFIKAYLAALREDNAAVLGVVVLMLLVVSMSQLRGVKTKADYLVAGRSLPAFVLVFTLLSSWIGAGSLFAGAENAYRNGFAALWQPAGGWAGLLLIYFIAPRARSLRSSPFPICSKPATTRPRACSA